MHAVFECATCCPADFSPCYMGQAKMPCLNTKQHRHSIFRKVKQLLIMLLSCIYVQDKFFCLLIFFDSIHVEARGKDEQTYGEKENKKSDLNSSVGHNPFPPLQHFPKRTLAPLPMFAHFIGSSTEFPFSACINPDAMQHVLGVCRGYRARAHQPEHHTGTSR